MTKKQIAAKLFQHLCEHNWHGYSQVSRWGDGEGTCDITINGVVYRLEQGDRDCSSAIISCYEAAGIKCGGATYTGNMRDRMCSTGNFEWKPMSYIAQTGDCYLNHVNHTAMCISAVPDMLGEFSISETGGIDGAEGDQTGRESSIKPYYSYPWDGILRCTVTGNSGGNASTKSYTVKYGDNLTYIAKNHNTTIKKLCDINKISDPDKIYVGQILIIK